MKEDLPNILILISDCTRANKLSCYGYKKQITPNIDKIAKEGTRFTNCYTQGVWTLPTHTSLFTGLYPSEHGLLSASQDLNVKIKKSYPHIAEQLRELGYITAGISNNPWVGSLSDMDRGFDFFMESDGTIKNKLDINIKLPGKIKFMNGIQKKAKSFFFKLLIPYLVKRPEFTDFSFDTAIKIMDFSKKIGKPFFIFMNLMDSHQPYYPPRSKLQKFGSKRYIPFSSLIDNVKINRYYHGMNIKNIYKILNDYYDASLSYQDEVLGRFIKDMRKQKILDDTMFFFTADHGKTLGEYNQDDIHFMKNEVLNIPLIVRFPNKMPINNINESIVQLIDINFTIRQYLSLKKSHQSDVTLFDTLNGIVREYSHSEAELPFNFFEKKGEDPKVDHVIAIISGKGKMVISKSNGLLKSVFENNREIFDKKEITEIDPYLLDILEEHKKSLKNKEKTILKNVFKTKLKFKI